MLSIALVVSAVELGGPGHRGGLRLMLTMQSLGFLIPWDSRGLSLELPEIATAQVAEEGAEVVAQALSEQSSCPAGEGPSRRPPASPFAATWAANWAKYAALWPNISEMLPRHKFLGEMIASQLIYYPTIIREPFRNRITDLMTSGKLFEDIGLPNMAIENDRFMLCGSPEMIQDTREMLTGRGCAAGNHGKAAHYVIENAFVGSDFFEEQVGREWNKESWREKFSARIPKWKDSLHPAGNTENAAIAFGLW